MDFSKEDKEMVGQNLVDQVISMAGVPKEQVKTELNDIIDEMGFHRDEITLNQVRLVLVTYLEQVNSNLTLK